MGAEHLEKLFSKKAKTIYSQRTLCELKTAWSGRMPESALAMAVFHEQAVRGKKVAIQRCCWTGRGKAGDVLEFFVVDLAMII